MNVATELAEIMGWVHERMGWVHAAKHKSGPIGSWQVSKDAGNQGGIGSVEMRRRIGWQVGEKAK